MGKKRLSLVFVTLILFIIFSLTIIGMRIKKYENLIYLEYI
ncbi:hypothetical protein M918_02155 [Clostridium sp. BL8]|nr:hypothetical protein M918_02155 [Clostridium sp. BL8]